MSSDPPDDQPHDDEHLPAEVAPRGLEKLEPHQQSVERVARVYYEGCRRVASAITAIKRRLKNAGE